MTLIVPLDNGVTNQLMRPAKMRYDARNFSWIGSSNQTNVVMVVRTDSGIEKLSDLKTKKSYRQYQWQKFDGLYQPDADPRPVRL